MSPGVRGSSPRSRLRRLDERVLPGAAAPLQRAVRSVTSWVVRQSAPGRLAADAVRQEPALAGSIAAVVAAAVLVGAFGAGQPVSSASRPAPPVPVPTVPRTVTALLGPQPGTPVAAYLHSAAKRLQSLEQDPDGTRTLALVNLRGYRTPARAAGLFRGYSVVRIYVRVPSRRLPTIPKTLTLAHGFADLPAAMSSAAQQASATVAGLQSVLAGLQDNTPLTRKARAKFTAQLHATQLDAARLAAPERCACVFAVVVRADARALRVLTREHAVRVVDPAPPAASLETLNMLALEPEIHGVVPLTGYLD